MKIFRIDNLLDSFLTQLRDIDLVFVQCCASVFDAGTTLNKHWINDSGWGLVREDPDETIKLPSQLIKTVSMRSGPAARTGCPGEPAGCRSLDTHLQSN